MTSDWAGHEAVSAAESASGNRSYWDVEATDYYAEHGTFLGDRDLVWGPEGWREEELHLLGDLCGLRVLEIRAGAAQGARWCADHGAAEVLATDLSIGMLRQGRRLDAALPLVQADASALPVADESVDVVFTAYGAVPFIADTAALMREVARVIRPGGRFVYSTTHPIRWAFPDVPGVDGLTVSRSYFDTTPYAERSGDVVTYAEHHRTMSARIREVLDAGLVLTDLREPEWPERNRQVWGGWSPTRGAMIPGTMILAARKP